MKEMKLVRRDSIYIENVFNYESVIISGCAVFAFVSEEVNSYELMQS
jgi:hypothetical protein